MREGSWGAQIVDELVPDARDIRVTKYRYSGFWDTPLDTILRNLGVTTLFFAGVNADQCVMTTLQDAMFLGYDCVMVEDCVGTTSPGYCMEATLYNVKLLFGFVTGGPRPFAPPSRRPPLPGAVDARLAALGPHAPAAAGPIASFLPFRVTGRLVFLAGQTCEREGRIVYDGTRGVEVSRRMRGAPPRCARLNLLAALKAACGGDLDAVARCVSVRGFVQAPPGFGRVPQIIDGASDLFVAIWGDEGRHARTAVGVSTLPQNAAVEVDALFELGPT